MNYPVNIKNDTNGTVLVSFVDLNAHSVGDDVDEALLNAVDALETAIAGLMERRQAVPVPSPAKRRQKSVALPALIVAKVALWNEMINGGLRKVDLARELDWHMPQVDRLFNLRHATKLDALERAATAMGKTLSINVA